MRRRASRWLPTAQAFLAVLAVCAVVYLCFDYGYVVSDRGEQRNSISRMLEKLGLKDRTQLAVFALKNNIV